MAPRAVVLVTSHLPAMVDLLQQSRRPRSNRHAGYPQLDSGWNRDPRDLKRQPGGGWTTVTRPRAGHDSPGSRSRAPKLRATDRGPGASSSSFVSRILRSVGSRRTVCVSASGLVLLLLLPAAGLVQHIYFNRSGLPDLEPFVRFELPTIGQVYDTNGKVLVELAREYRRVVPYAEVPPVLRDAILAAEDKNFFSHSGVEYRALLRVGYKTAAHSVAAWRKNGFQLRLRFPQGGSTLTQQLVRGYFLRDRVSREDGASLLGASVPSRLLFVALGIPAPNKLLRHT